MVPVRHCKVTAVYNHKGGVGKTTTVATLGWEIASRGNRTLLIDWDQQCNLTGFLVDPGSELFPVAQQAHQDPLEAFFETFPKANIRAHLAPFLADTEELIEMGLTQTDRPTDVFPVHQRRQFWPAASVNIYDTKTTAPPSTLFLLAGDINFYDYMDKIKRACDAPDSIRDGRTLPGCFASLFDRLATTHNLDHIILDLSPSGGVLNKLLLMSSDFFIVPCSPDYFSFMAIQSIPKMLTDWDAWKMDHPAFSLPLRKPIFLGYTIQVGTLPYILPCC